MIIEESYEWRGTLRKRTATKEIIIHHEAGKGMSAQQIHRFHRDENGWSGIGYHFYIRTDGSIYRGRPIDTVGTHCAGHNEKSIGICFEGNYETTKEMPRAQYEAGVLLVAELLRKYPAGLYKHKDFNATACPGKYFPWERFENDIEEENMSGEEIYKRLTQYLSTLEESDWSENEGGFKWAKDRGIMDGTNPRGLLTREQLAAVLSRILKK